MRIKILSLAKLLLRHKHCRTFFCLLLGHVVQIFMGLFFAIWTSRLIAPYELGRWSCAIFIFNGYSMLSDLGLEVGAMQNQATEEKNITFLESIFLLRSCLSMLPFLGCCLFSLIFFRLDFYIFLYAVFFWLDKTSNFLKILWDKNFLQTKATFFETLGFCLSNTVAIFFAKIGLVGYVLPMQKIGEKLFLLSSLKSSSMAFFSYSKINFQLILSLMKKFSLPTLSNNCFGLVLYDFMPFFIALIQGSVAAGLYAKAFSVAAMPLLITTVFNRITTPMYSFAGGDLLQCRNIFFKSQLIKAALIVPLILLLQQTAYVWFGLVFGYQWICAKPLFQILCFYALARSFYDDLGPLVNLGLEQPWLFTKNQGFHAAYTVLTLPIIFFKQDLFLIASLHSFGMFLTCAVMWREILFRFSGSSANLETF